MRNMFFCNCQNLVISVVFDVHQVKLDVLLLKHSPWGLPISSSVFEGLVVFSIGPLGSEQTFQTLEKFLIGPYRLSNELCSDNADHAKLRSRP